MIETRFPIGLGRDQVRARCMRGCGAGQWLSTAHWQVRIAFTWYDAFKSHKRVEAYSLNLERAAVLFNVGAVLTQQALAADASTSSGLLECAKKFQVRRLQAYS